MRIKKTHIGLRVAKELYGADCVVSAGDFLHPATVDVPNDEGMEFVRLVAEEEDGTFIGVGPESDEVLVLIEPAIEVGGAG